jgi:hypothetical protein
LAPSVRDETCYVRIKIRRRPQGFERLRPGTPDASPASEQTGEVFEHLLRDIARDGSDGIVSKED